MVGYFTDQSDVGADSSSRNLALPANGMKTTKLHDASSTIPGRYCLQFELAVQKQAVIDIRQRSLSGRHPARDPLADAIRPTFDHPLAAIAKVAEERLGDPRRSAQWFAEQISQKWLVDDRFVELIDRVAVSVHR